MEQYIELSQKQGLAQHMIQSMEILQMNALERESYLENLELEAGIDGSAEQGVLPAGTRR